jgi:uncharacterized membrane protein YkvA (DUF1232 family)
MQRIYFDENTQGQPSWWKAKLDSMPPTFVIGLCIVYIISPIDLAPEAFLGPFGLFDDCGAVFIALRAIKKAIIG